MRAQAERASAEQADASQVAVQLERARIARELHDIVAHHISVIIVQARGGRRCLESARTTPVRALTPSRNWGKKP